MITKLDIQTLAFIACLTFLAQFITLWVQFLVNRTYRGIKWWLVGCGLCALGVIFKPLVVIKSLEPLAMIANPLDVLGLIFIFIGISRFLDKKENKWTLIVLFTVFLCLYYYFMFGYNGLSERTFAITSTLTVISGMTAFKLYFYKEKIIASSANFTALVFLIYACFSMVRIFFVLLLPPMQAYSDQQIILELTFIVPIIISMLWTFGFIIMMNQRLNAENCIEKEKLQLIFDTTPDAVMISRLSGGSIVDVNTGFIEMSGYSRSEAVGNKTTNINIWHQSADRESYLKELKEHGICENKEYVFRRKNGSLLTGSISAKVITFQSIPHVVSTVRDITEHKQAEERIQQLIQQLEIEKKTAQLNANTDSLTALASRRYFDEMLCLELEKLTRTGAVMTLIMVDVDHFKKYNDCHGHLAGDACLRQIGAMLKALVSSVTDTAARYGGDELVVILPETNQPQGIRLAEQIRIEVEKLAIPHNLGSGAGFITVSLGVITLSAADLVSPEQVVALADAALYDAKKGGRNRIAVYEQTA